MWTVEFSDEVRQWYASLSPAGLATADRILTRLQDVGHELRMPHSRQLGEGLCELRFTCESVARRITYVFEPERRVITLTTFRKQRDNERAEILRARRGSTPTQGGTMNDTTTWTAARESALAALDADQRAVYDASAIEAEARLELAELVYNARTGAGFTQVQLAERAGTTQAVISAIENGAQAPGGIMLERIARALGGTLRIDLAA